MAINPLNDIYRSRIGQKYVSWATDNVVKHGVKQPYTNYDRLQKVFPPAFLTFVMLGQCGFLATSKDMPKERKIPLIFNNLYACAIALTIGALTGKRIDKFIEKMAKRAEDVYEKRADKAKLVDGIRGGIPILKEAFLFEYVGYTAAVPLGTQTSNYLASKGIIKFDKKDSNSEKK